VNDEFITGLMYEIKQEIIDNFFSERRRLDEERAIFGEMVAEQRPRLRALARAQTRLKRLLLDEAGLQGFCALSGAPAEFLTQAPREQPRAREFRARGLTFASRYGALLGQAYDLVASRAEECAERQADIEAALAVYNEDAEHYRRNFDVLSIVAVLNRMAPDELDRRHWLGENFRPEETASLADSLNAPPLAMPKDLQRVSVALPELKAMRSRLKGLARELCRRKPEEARAELARCLQPVTGDGTGKA
jgi:hypothetical protein